MPPSTLTVHFLFPWELMPTSAGLSPTATQSDATYTITYHGQVGSDTGRERPLPL
jgi:hypothetical protein